jgi:hypothetical protein
MSNSNLSVMTNSEFAYVPIGGRTARMRIEAYEALMDGKIVVFRHDDNWLKLRIYGNGLISITPIEPMAHPGNQL